MMTSSNSTVRRSLKWCVHLGLIPAAASMSQQQQDQDTYHQRIQEMRQHYQNLVDQFPFPDEGHDDDDDESKDQHEAAAVAEQQQQALAVSTSISDSDVSFLDPLTALVLEQESRTERLQKLDLKYRKEKAMRNRGKATERTVEEDEIDPRVERSVALQVIDKDLARLPPPPPSTSSSGSSAFPPSSSSESILVSEQQTIISKRKAILRRVLYCFHCATHDTPGYRQGMHEIASYLLHALEIEQHQQVENNETANAGVGDDDDDDDDALGAQVYSMLHAILMAILPAYDVSSSQNQPININNNSNTSQSPTSQHAAAAAAEQHHHHHHQVHDKNKPLEGMSRRILAQVAIHDAVLCRRLQVDLQVPAQLYLTKWIRLLYSREVAANQVLFFWDALLELMTTTTSTTTMTMTSTTMTTSLMSVLETVAAARLLLWRGRLHVPAPPPVAAGQEHQHHQHDDHDTLHLLMNLPMETMESTREWLQLSRQMICYNQSRQLLWSTCVKDQPPLPLVTLPPLTVVPGVVVGPSPPATMNNTSATTSTFTTSAAARMNLPSSVFGAAPGNNNNNINNNNNNTSNPIMDRFSFTSVRQNLEQTVKSTTQSIGQRLHQEWEHLAADLGGVGGGVSPTGGAAAAVNHGGTYSGVVPLRSNNNRAAAGTAADAYNITYRDSPLFDPPVPLARAATTTTSNNNDIQLLLQQQHAAWARQLQVQTATLQSFLIQVEQEHERHHGSNNHVPPIVWEALATLESMRLEMTLNSSTAPSP